MVHYIQNNLLRHKITILKDKTTGTADFMTIANEVSMIIGYEVFKDFPLKETEIETPIEKSTELTLAADKKPCIIPILRAGLAMMGAFRAIMPTAKVGMIGLYRDEETLEPHEYYCKLPKKIDLRQLVVIDPMLATGGSACDAIQMVKDKGGRDIIFACIIAAPEGVEAVQKAHPDVDIYVGHLDKGLLPNGYIYSGLGDFGDRFLGTP